MNPIQRALSCVVAMCLGVMIGCDSEVNNPTTAGDEAEKATQDYHRQVDDQERGQQGD